MAKAKQQDTYLSVKDCKEGYLYHIGARNSSLGICHRDKGIMEFWILRHKFGDVFIDSELHWDEDAHYGTAKPIVELEQVPPDTLKDRGLMFAYLKEVAFKYPTKDEVF